MTPATPPTTTSSALYPLRLRADMDRDAAYTYWAGTHAQIAARLPNLLEYNQYHFSATDHSYWPGTDTVGTRIPDDWRSDGMTEVRLPGLLTSMSIPLHMREILFDEQNVFEHCLGHLSGPGGGRWWTNGHDDTVGHRTAVLIRRRRGVTGRAFRSFVHQQLGAALHTAGARDVRSYTFLPMVVRAHSTFGVSHHNPPHRRQHGAVVFGTDTRDDVEKLLASPALAAVVEAQHRSCVGLYAHTVDRTVAVIRTTSAARQSIPQAKTQDDTAPTNLATLGGSHGG
ncbi:hypothetical protein [Mycobacterium colombiense]|uniref:EthD domain-containing protein n=1 Tax=Mycobacterium colombiense TaxID=339268 RepID=A0A1A2YNY1_9MYCO|nr:hypothetical protein [Mycobacterium colombiense]OBI39710.1 hypothetical protein A5708_02980 [Mycobacterium colombiense]